MMKFIIFKILFLFNIMNFPNIIEDISFLETYINIDVLNIIMSHLGGKIIIFKIRYLNKFFNSYILEHGIRHCKRLCCSDKIKNCHVLMFKSLEELELSWNRNITDEAMIKLDHLTDLNLGFSSIVTDNGIYQLKLLRSLILGSNNNITDNGINHLTLLRSLSLSLNKNISDNGIIHLTLLRFLDLGLNTNITDKSISQLTNLTNLDLSVNKNITDKGINKLTSLTRLETGGNLGITNEGISKLFSLRTLKKHNFITSSGLKLLTNLTNINGYEKKNDLTYGGVRSRDFMYVGAEPNMYQSTINTREILGLDFSSMAYF